MNFSRTASYSMSVLSHMARQENSVMTAVCLHEKLGISYPYLRRVLSNLSRHNLIRSLKGRGGGFVLARKSNMIFLVEIIEVTDNLEVMEKCILGFRRCPFDNKCALHSKWEAARNDIMKILKETSLADIISVNGQA